MADSRELKRALISAARQDAMTDEIRFRIGQAIGVIGRLETAITAIAHQGDAGVSAEPSEQTGIPNEAQKAAQDDAYVCGRNDERRAREQAQPTTEPSEREIVCAFQNFGTGRWDGFLAAVRALQIPLAACRALEERIARPAQPTTGGEFPAPCSEHPELHCLAPANCATTGLCARRLGDA